MSAVPLMPPPSKAPSVPKAPGKAPPPKAKGKAAPPPKRGACAGPEAIGPKLRPLFWTSVTEIPPDSVFAKLVLPAPFDTKLLEQQFALTESRSASSKRDLAEPEQRKRLRVLDDRTSRNLAIVFSRLPPAEQLASMLDTFEGFPEELPSEAVLAMNSAMLEQKEAVDQIRQLGPEADISQLDMPERYLWVLSSVPSCIAKLTCGALIVGKASELGDLRRAAEMVGSCCTAMQHSKLLRKCISTSFAIGNILNRGTSRAGAAGIVLPDSLLKLDELRCAPTDAGTLLDFVAQALADEANSVEVPKNLCQEIEDLRLKCRSAQTVSLEEAEASCLKISKEVEHAQKGLLEMTSKAGTTRIESKVHSISEEAKFALKFLALAKKELTKTLQWSTVKGTVKSNDFFEGWGTFLEQLGRAMRAAEQRRQQQISKAANASIKEVNAHVEPMLKLHRQGNMDLSGIGDDDMHTAAASKGEVASAPATHGASDSAFIKAAQADSAPLKPVARFGADKQQKVQSAEIYDDNVTVGAMMVTREARHNQLRPQDLQVASGLAVDCNTASQGTAAKKQVTTLFNAWSQAPGASGLCNNKENVRQPLMNM